MKSNFLVFGWLILVQVGFVSQSKGQYETILCQEWVKEVANEFINDPIYNCTEKGGFSIRLGNHQGITYIQFYGYHGTFGVAYDWKGKMFTESGILVNAFDSNNPNIECGYCDDFPLDNEQYIYSCEDEYPYCNPISGTYANILCKPCVQNHIESTLSGCDSISIAFDTINQVIDFGCNIGGFYLFVINQFDYNNCIEIDYCENCTYDTSFVVANINFLPCNLCNTEIEMVQGVECILPQVISTGEILYPCEYTNGATTLPGEIGYKTKIAYTPYEGNQCFSVCLQGTAVSIGCVQPVDTCIYHPDYAPLMALYHASNGPGWINNTGWQDGAAGTNCDPCNGWYGVVCDSSRVTRINIYGNNLDGSLPAEVGELSKLKSFLAGGSNISGLIPSEIGNLSKLENFSVSDSNLEGEIPSSFNNLTNLKFLSLNNNNLSGQLPEYLGELSELTIIYLFDNNFSGNIPASYGDLINLKQLWLQNNNLSGCLPENLANLCGIVELNVINNNPLLATQSWTNFCNNQEGMCSPSNTDDEAYNHVYNIYPNPGSDHITINNIEKIEKVAFVSMDGSYVYASKPQSHILDVSTLPSAIYAVRITAIDGKIHHIKFVKK